MSTAPAPAIQEVVLETVRGCFGALVIGPMDVASTAPFVCYVHGAGMCGWSFARCAEATLRLAGARGLALDLRCHGRSHDEGGEASLSMTVLVDDTIACVAEACRSVCPAAPPVYLVGHSLGGAIVTNVLARKALPFAVAAAVVIDIVEGTARQSLTHMKTFLDRRPKEFPTTEAAARWFVAHGGMRRLDAALVSVPPLLRCGGDGVFRWRTALEKTQPHWEGWFEDLDSRFVGIPCPKMLCLATTDRLDKALTIAQMMGKFQLEVVGGGAGHYVMEDEPDIVAGKLARLIQRMDVLLRKLPQLNRKT